MLGSWTRYPVEHSLPLNWLQAAALIKHHNGFLKHIQIQINEIRYNWVICETSKVNCNKEADSKWAVGPANDNRAERLFTEQVEDECQRSRITAKGQHSSYWTFSKWTFWKSWSPSKRFSSYKKWFCSAILLNYQRKISSSNKIKWLFPHWDTSRAYVLH